MFPHEKLDRKHRVMLTDATLQPLLKRLKVYQDNYIPLSAIAFAMDRSLRTIQHHTRRGYLYTAQPVSYVTMKRSMVRLPDFMNYVQMYWRIDKDGRYVFKRRREPHVEIDKSQFACFVGELEDTNTDTGSENAANTTTTRT